MAKDENLRQYSLARRLYVGVSDCRPNAYGRGLKVIGICFLEEIINQRLSKA